MGLLTSVLTGSRIMAGGPAADADFWYGTPGAVALSGVTVNAATALKLSAFYRGVSLISRALASVPWVIQRNLPDDEGKERAKRHPLYRLIHRRPNLWQTSFEFRQMGQWRVLLRGNFYARLTATPYGLALSPLHPDHVEVKLLATGRRGYLYKPPGGGAPEPITQDEMFHVAGPSFDGVKGVSAIEYARESLGRAIAQQEYGARFFSQNATPATTITHPGRLSQPAQKNLEESIERRAGGLQGAHKFMVLEEGMKLERIGLTMRDSQFIELDTFGILDVARWLGVQPHKLMEMSHATFGNIEHQAIEFLTDTMDPWFVCWEQAAERDLLGDDDDHSVEFVREGLLRGDLLSRAQAYSQFVQNGIMSENEVRARESLNKWPGLDAPRRSANQDRGGDPLGPRPGNGLARSRPAPDDTDTDTENENEDEDDGTDRAREIARLVAVRLVAREINEARKWAARCAARCGNDDRAWREAVSALYGRHVDSLVRELQLDVKTARRYGAEHAAALIERGPEILDEWERDAPAALAALALGR